MEIKDLILLLWRNVRYIVLGLILGVAVGVVVSNIQPPVYEATTKVFVSRARQQGNSDMLSMSDEQLLAINLQLAKSQPVLNEVSSQLGSKIDVNNIQVGVIPNSLIIQIKVQDEDPQRAATTANLLVQTLIQQNESLLSPRYEAFETGINEQLDQVQKQIDILQSQIGQINDTGLQEQLTQVNQQIEKLEVKISDLQKEIGGFSDTLTPLERITLAEKQAQLDQFHSLMSLYQQIQTNLTYIGKPSQNNFSPENPQLAALQSTLNLYQQIYQTLINSRESVGLARTQSRQNVMQIVSATQPKTPVRPLPALYVLLGGVVGLILAVTSILIFDHLDDSLKSPVQIEKLLGVPVLGLVFEDKRNKNELVTVHDPFSTESGAFRSLGASLEITGTGKRFQTVLIMNAEQAGSRTTIAANLAVINARQGKRVILMDGDLRHPYLHDLFGMENKMGFAELLNDKVDIKNACHAVTDIEGLTLIPSGLAEKELTGWLDVKKWEQLLLKLHNLADLVIVDSPPADAADAQILASKMDVVLLVVKAGSTRVDTAQAALRKFQKTGAGVTGVVLNRTMQNRAMNKRFLTRLKIRTQKSEKPADGEIDKPAISVS